MGSRILWAPSPILSWLLIDGMAKDHAAESIAILPSREPSPEGTSPVVIMAALILFRSGYSFFPGGASSWLPEWLVLDPSTFMPPHLQSSIAPVIAKWPEDWRSALVVEVPSKGMHRAISFDIARRLVWYGFVRVTEYEIRPHRSAGSVGGSDGEN